MGLQYVRGAQVSLKHHPGFNERWLREIIVDDPTILGLGPLQIAAVERLQQGGGRLDLLLQQDRRRYVVELMLGSIDESHIVRGLEYWDLECRTHPEFEHWMVLVAEELGGRFHNVLRLLKHTVPMIGLQVTGVRVGDLLTLSFTRMLDDRGRRSAAGGAPRRRPPQRVLTQPMEANARADPAPASTLFPESWLPPRK